MEMPAHDMTTASVPSLLQTFLAVSVATQFVVVGGSNLVYPPDIETSSDMDRPRHSTTITGRISAIVEVGGKSVTLGNTL